MDFELNDEHKMIKEMVYDFARKEMAPIAVEIDETERFPEENFKKMADLHLLGLPIEEWLFFICVPYACVFLYETFRTWIPGYPFKKWGTPTMVLVLGVSLALVVLYPERYYTFYTALFTALGLAFVWWRYKPQWMGWFAFSYLIILIPFLISNGVLTGIEFWQYPFLNEAPEAVNDQIVWYNNAHNLRFRIMSVPIDDTLYGFLLIGMNVTIYEGLMKRYQLR